MSISELSPAAQNYLKVIWGLQEWSDDPVTASTIAAKSRMKLSTVSGAISKLVDQGFVEHAPYGSVTLTEAGRAHALTMVRRHRLIEAFLVSVLGYRWDEVHDEAEHLEHAVSDFFVERMDRLLGFPRRDPHGDPIPSADGELQVPEAVLLAHVRPGATVTVERISDDDPDLLRFFADRGIVVGATLGVQEAAPYSDAIEVNVGGGAQIALGGAAAASVWVTRPHSG